MKALLFFLICATAAAQDAHRTRFVVEGKEYIVTFTNDTQFVTVDDFTFGRYSHTIHPGQRAFIANQLFRGDDLISSLFAGVPAGIEILIPKSGMLLPNPEANHGRGGTFLLDSFNGERWKEPQERMPCGTGVIFRNRSTNTIEITFSGLISKQPLTNHIVSGFSFICCPKPRAGTIDELGFPREIGDVIYQLDESAQRTLRFTNTAAGWVPSVPRLEIGEGFTVNKIYEADWVCR